MEHAWTRVDAISRPSNLSADDTCFYYYEYTPRAGCFYSTANSDVLNYKIKIEALRLNPDRTRYKVEAIETYVDATCSLLDGLMISGSSQHVSDFGERVGLVPVPPSKRVDNEFYDDRNVRTCDAVAKRMGFRVCRDVETVTEIGESHSGGSRDPKVIESSIARVGRGCDECEIVFVVDDVLNSGAHFTAVKHLLESTGCVDSIYGVFFARSIG